MEPSSKSVRRGGLKSEFIETHICDTAVLLADASHVPLKSKSGDISRFGTLTSAISGGNRSTVRPSASHEDHEGQFQSLQETLWVLIRTKKNSERPHQGYRPHHYESAVQNISVVFGSVIHRRPPGM